MKALAFFAHPDDETILAGGTLALLAHIGADVYYLCATDGGGGELGDPPVCNREDLGKFRQRELECAVAALGGKQVRSLNYIDPLVGNNNELFAFADDFDLLVRQVMAEIISLSPEILISHGSNGEYGHPAHVQVYQAAHEAVQRLGNRAPTWYTVQAAYAGNPKPHAMNINDPADLILDISSVLDRKIKAAFCHQSQNALFVRRKSKEAGQIIPLSEAIVSSESLHLAFTPSGQDLLKQMLLPLNCFLENSGK